MTTTNELRQMFADFFIERDHIRVASSPIAPPDDPTMLFTSAGMVQFKQLYSGMIDPLPYTRATTVQKCLRAGGKGSDLENVGKTMRHHTFFEMLGNFSFGDYFKIEAMEWGWDFIWNKMKLPRERLWATYFEEDEETAILLEKEIGIPSDRIIPLDAKENFWGPAGDTGACGPCSEICFFTGTEGELQEALKQSPEVIARRIVEEGDLFLEIWNMVFPQFDQQKDGSRPPLKNRGIDTGAGLERMTTVMQFIESGGKVRSPYETDLMSGIVTGMCGLLDVNFDDLSCGEVGRDPRRRYWINAITDHSRALTFALSEGLVPSNEGRGYVLRRILRRALRFAHLMGREEPFLYKGVDLVIDAMGDAYPEIKSNPAHVARIIKIEEERFLRTVAQGSKILDEKIAQAKNDGATKLAGMDAFLLHSTYGYPVDMTAEIAEEAGLTLDREGYEKAMNGHQEEARKSWKGVETSEEASLLDDTYEKYGATDFQGYGVTECQARVVALVCGGERVEEINAGDEATVVLEQTPFYAESGGQVGDQGQLTGCDNNMTCKICDTVKIPNGLFLHIAKMESGAMRVGDTVQATVNTERRLATQRNHTVTHVMQGALKSVLGTHVTQSGSYVSPDGMRFDFSHPLACTSEELGQIEKMVNDAILADVAVTTEEMTLEKARKLGAIAPFGEKYGHMVRVVQVGDVSMELCGGTHLERSGQISTFRILSESSVAAGIRRIEGVTGAGAYGRWAATRDVAAGLSRTLAVKEEEIADRVAALQAEIKKLRKDVKAAKQSGGGGGSVSVDTLMANATEVDGIKVIVAKVEGGDADSLRDLADKVRDKGVPAVCLLGAAIGPKVMLTCAVTKSETKRIKAGDIIKQVAPLIGGGGGGRPDFAQAGGKQPERLDEAIEKAKEIIAGLIG